MGKRLIIVLFFLLWTLSSFAKGDKSVLFSGSIITQSLNISSPCIKNANESKDFLACFGESKHSVTVKTAFQDFHFTGSNVIRREITITYN